MNPERMSLEALRAELLREPAVQAMRCSDAGSHSYCAPRGGEAPSLLEHRLSIAREILVRAAYDEAVGQTALGSPNASREYFRLHFATLPYEVFLVAYLDCQNRVIAIEEAFRGTVTATSVYPREIVRRALYHNATAIIAGHQHPSGVGVPSAADEMLTGALRQALGLVDVKFLDHLIFAAGEFLSFAQKGLL